MLISEGPRRRYSVTMFSDLPEEISIDILARLPVKSLIRCGAVSKTLRSLIRSSSFIETHFHHSDLTPQFLIRPIRYRNLPHNDVPLTLHLRLNQISPENPPPTDNVSPSFPSSVINYANPDYVETIVVTCNGIALVATTFRVHKSPTSFHLWNLATRQIFVLPPHTVKIRPYGMGFGFDPVDKDYKVVKVQACCYRRTEVIHVRAEVYSVNAGVWREINVHHKFVFLSNRHCDCSFDGRVYWTVRDQVVAFHLNSLEFTTYIYPPEFKNTGVCEWPFNHKDCRVFNYKDSVALALVTGNTSVREFTFWCLKFDNTAAGYSWKKTFSSPLIPGMTGFYAFLKNGNFIAEICVQDMVHTCLYDPFSKESKSLQVSIQPGWLTNLYFNYTESLVPLTDLNTSR